MQDHLFLLEGLCGNPGRHLVSEGSWICNDVAPYRLALRVLLLESGFRRALRICSWHLLRFQLPIPSGFLWSRVRVWYVQRLHHARPAKLRLGG